MWNDTNGLQRIILPLVVLFLLANAILLTGAAILKSGISVFKLENLIGLGFLGFLGAVILFIVYTSLRDTNRAMIP